MEAIQICLGLNSEVHVSTAFWTSVKNSTFLLARCEDNYYSFAASVFMLLVTRKCKKSHVPGKLITLRVEEKNRIHVKYFQKLFCQKAQITMQGTHWFYSFISLRYSASVMLIQNSNMLPMNEYSIAIAWFYSFSSKPVLTVQCLFLLNDVFPQILITYSSYTSLVVSPTALYLGLVWLESANSKFLCCSCIIFGTYLTLFCLSTFQIKLILKGV